MRYAVRRIRRKLPAARVVLACLTKASGTTAEQLGESAKADLVATSLRDVVRVCLREAAGTPAPEQENEVLLTKVNAA
jgi:hypothetical protein